jgi:hypothetical protein
MRYYNLKKFNSTKEYLKAQIKQWKRDSLKKNPRCLITNQVKDVEVHHLNKSFSQILEETFIKADLPQHKTTTNYTQQELLKLSNICLALHYKYGLGVAMGRDIHKLFHKEYGYNATKKDYYEFKKRFKSGNIKLDTKRVIS